ncbi:3267_t:CDS:2 [Cetraspora pellucida]|uniref:3267_t:CDS:1 n=1 Tax=Cetraspora pellucida TaxID=1433469 RepID=A0ACA9K5U2_9GLOM|nr:3267_t:CDS:2 [Cetraspora pellucida]
MLITDFGLSKRMDETSTYTTANFCGMNAYIDPQCFKNSSPSGLRKLIPILRVQQTNNHDSLSHFETTHRFSLSVDESDIQKLVVGENSTTAANNMLLTQNHSIQSEADNDQFILLKPEDVKDSPINDLFDNSLSNLSTFKSFKSTGIGYTMECKSNRCASRGK